LHEGEGHRVLEEIKFADSAEKSGEQREGNGPGHMSNLYAIRRNNRSGEGQCTSPDEPLNLKQTRRRKKRTAVQRGGRKRENEKEDFKGSCNNACAKRKRKKEHWWLSKSPKKA